MLLLLTGNQQRNLHAWMATACLSLGNATESSNIATMNTAPTQISFGSPLPYTHPAVELLRQLLSHGLAASE
jgi:hypothetical protein